MLQQHVPHLADVLSTLLLNPSSRDEMGRTRIDDLICAETWRRRCGPVHGCLLSRTLHPGDSGITMIADEGRLALVASPSTRMIFPLLRPIRPGYVKVKPGSSKVTHDVIVLTGGRYSQDDPLF
ncbi:hypothetical protein BC835DRAFT_1421031 [Cytidiella melzeri]|nr:hypothetical protein BC835DRAFT_1421031 [Cytidiella melzeri]